MLALQGEGLELDLQRRRHPMWEWLFSHPMPPGAIFLAEMLVPLASNPVYWTAPLFVGILYGFVHGWSLGILAAFCMGIPLAVAGGCVGKALEIAAVLRFPPRSRGAMIGVDELAGICLVLLVFSRPRGDSVDRWRHLEIFWLSPLNALAVVTLVSGRRNRRLFLFPIGSLQLFDASGRSHHRLGLVQCLGRATGSGWELRTRKRECLIRQETRSPLRQRTAV